MAGDDIRMNKKFMEKVVLSLGIGVMGASSLGVTSAFADTYSYRGQFVSKSLAEYQNQVEKEIKNIEAKEKELLSELDAATDEYSREVENEHYLTEAKAKYTKQLDKAKKEKNVKNQEKYQQLLNSTEQDLKKSTDRVTKWKLQVENIAKSKASQKAWREELARALKKPTIKK